MGRTVSELGSAAMRGFGFNCEPVSPPDFQTLMLGRKHTLCKECLPLILVTGSMLDHVHKRKNENENLLYFMPTSRGSCRFAQYYIFLGKVIEKKKIKNVTLFTLSSTNSFAGIGTWNALTLLKAINIGDVMDDIKNAIDVLAKDKNRALRVFEEQVKKIEVCLEESPKRLYRVLREVARELSRIELRYPLSEATKVLVAGEIYVRKEEFASSGVVDRLKKRGIVVKRSPVLEYLYYTDFLAAGEYKSKVRLRDKGEILTKRFFKQKAERNINKILAGSNLYEFETVGMKKLLELGSHFIHRSFTGEMILVIGSFFKEIVKHDPENAEIWCSWGVALMELKQFDEAVEKFEKAAGFSPDFAPAWYGWGIALSALGQKEAAAEKVKKAMELDPDSSQEPS